MINETTLKPHTDKMKPNISETIRLIREKKGYSQDFVASKLFITQQSYSRLERNPESMTLSRLRDLAKILDISLLNLLGDENMYFMQNINPQGGNADTKLVLNETNTPIEKNELFKGMQNEIIFLRDLVLKLQT
jgi:transcriptional regulator with XRE-family HTH domain